MRLPARASHPALATSRPPGWPRLRALAPTRRRCLPTSTLPSPTCTHFRARPPLVTAHPRLRVSARSGYKSPARPNPRRRRRRRRRYLLPSFSAWRSTGGMAGIGKRRTSPVSTSSYSGGDVLPQRVTRKRRSVRRGPRSGAALARRPSSALRPVSASEFTASCVLICGLCAPCATRLWAVVVRLGAVGWRPRGRRLSAIPSSLVAGCFKFLCGIWDSGPYD